MKNTPFMKSICCSAVLALTTACPPPAEDAAPKTDDVAADAKATGDATAAGATAAAASKPGEPVNTTISRGSGAIAKVNGVELARTEFDRQLDKTEQRFQRAGRNITSALETRLKENLVRKLVDEELIRQRAEKEGVKLDAGALEKRFEEHKKRFGSDEKFTAFLERTKQKEEDVKADLQKNLMRESLFAKVSNLKDPSNSALKKYYDENKDKYKQREQLKASHVLFKVDKAATDEDKKAKWTKAKEVYDRAKKGEDFAALAKEFSEGPTARRGGDLGKFQRGRMVKAFEDAAFALKSGEIAGPVETQFGYHVIKAFEKEPERMRTFDEVKESIKTSLTARAKSQATRDVLSGLKKDAQIEVLEPGVTLKPVPDAAAAGRRKIGGAATKTLKIPTPTAKPVAAPATH